jgi:hypothetical protein
MIQRVTAEEGVRVWGRPSDSCCKTRHALRSRAGAREDRLKLNAEIVSVEIAEIVWRARAGSPWEREDLGRQAPRRRPT